MRERDIAFYRVHLNGVSEVMICASMNQVFNFSVTYSGKFEDLVLHIEGGDSSSILNSAGHQSPGYPCSPSIFYTRSSINYHP